MPTSSAEFDRHMMDIAVRMARRGLGTTAPNPSVGAIVVDEGTGEVIARGWTQPGGRPHAEKEALRRAGERARGRTMYLTLEPCAHTGRLPTCADAMVMAGLKRVVCAIPDPNPIVSGRGFRDTRPYSRADGSAPIRAAQDGARCRPCRRGRQRRARLGDEPGGTCLCPSAAR
ncbi:MAG: bifunctional diaminohydroxyphosphoribosylaminopyrimidine deaminase/5-amino-6-(5-phosphoribosylamino)uracil reductase RibD [Hyphomicrobium sp.]|nr:bifunctional diaminohydroxyphosphoribosylaminopyrimidine deaminase/5-amino-6-(5-phosphoribosylamino)uracil reductase RibD [Hyphomicrobium sp.]